MEEAQLETSKPSEILMGFPRYHRSHLKSETFRTLVRILSHCCENSELSGSSQFLFASQELKNRDNGTDRMERKSPEKEPEQFKIIGTGFVDPKDPAPENETHVLETFEGVGVQGREFSGEFMMGVEEDEDSSRIHDMMICESVEGMSVGANGMNREQKLIDELYQIVEGTEKPVCDSGLTPLNLGLDEQQNGSGEVDLMDYQVDHVEFQQSDINKSGTESELQVEGEFNQHASEGFHASLIANISTSTKEQTSIQEISTSSVKHEGQQKEMESVRPFCAAMGSLPTTEEGEFEKEEQCGQKVPEAMHFSVDQDMNSEALKLSEYGGDEVSLLDIDILEAKHVMQHEEQEPEKIICASDATTFSNHSIEEEEVEEGEISGDFEMDGDSFDMSSADALMLQQTTIDEVQKPKNVIGNIVFPFNIRTGEKEENYESTSSMVHTPQDAYNSGQVEPRTSDKNGLACQVDIRISEEINYGKAGEHGSVSETGKSKDRYRRGKEAVELPAALAHNQVLHRGLWKEEATEDHQNSSAVKKASVNCKKKRGPVTEEKKAKKKEKKRKKRAEKNRKLGVKRLKLLPVQKPKTITYCRHYLKGRCHEGDKCKFSHDTVPLTKSKPCCHFARHSCMKGDDCPFDHQLSKYPCSNFVTRGSCSRGDTCLFSHQMPTKQDIPTSSNDSKPELKPQLLLGNTNLSKSLNISGSSASQKKCSSDSKGIHSHTNSEHDVVDTVQKPPTLALKGISFINVAKSSSPNPSTLKQGMVTPNKESVVQIRTLKDQSASGTAQNLEDIPKISTVTPKGINFLSFGKGRVSSSKSSISSFLNRKSGINLSQLDNFGLPEQASSSLNKDDHSNVGDGTKQSVLQTALYSNEILKKNQSVAEGMNLYFPGKASIDDSATGLQCSLTSNQEHSLIRSVQERLKAYNSQTSTVTSSMFPVSPFVSGLSSERLAPGHHKHASNSVQRALLSTLSFAAEHESDIKMKCSAGTSAIRSDVNKEISNSSS